ncbi:MAG: 2-polyprenyl-3-methyl-6-methoxy-1,4-benzoquinone monooxygenase [Gammaproteobacteria bacterium]|nr:2-polyprenyl-3-methyl-6-methoxy-1,4-benzoquinone monooxygenase [Gammaproteobacteria bacterium]MCD8542453.1 2-polyprenyl-3-methyl-6-methoxy-1,4-benzoquinone monooxygenase [Gammaproteobacteria bacterium]
MRHFSFLDQVLLHCDLARKTLLVQPTHHQRACPIKADDSDALSEKEKKHAAGLMRVNHAGEVCAQALYQGQAITARSKTLREKMQHAADEELDHLAWCNQRLQELDNHASYLNIFWYLGAFGIAIAAGCVGDRWNLGFLAETEQQVVQHLESHLGLLPENDVKSRLIVEHMRDDEKQHRQMAQDNGAAELPIMIKKLMQFSSSVMTRLAYYV